MRQLSKKKFLTVPLVLVFCYTLALAQTVRDKDQAPTGKGTGNPNKIVDRYNRGNGGHHKPPPSNGIFYHGGPLILGGTHYYYIWYGNWSGNSATTIVPAFAHDESGSGYFNINTTYYDSSNTHVTNSIALD